MSIQVSIQTQALDLCAFYQHQHSDAVQHDSGAQVSFTGFVRQNDHAEAISHLFIEHYPQVTEQEIMRIGQLAQQKWSICHIHVVHRVGLIAVGEPIVWVAVSAKHRGDAYAANEFVMDYLKASAPFWKKEIFAHGQQHWVAAKKSDQVKQQSWAS